MILLVAPARVGGQSAGAACRRWRHGDIDWRVCARPAAMEYASKSNSDNLHVQARAIRYQSYGSQRFGFHVRHLIE